MYATTFSRAPKIYVEPLKKVKRNPQIKCQYYKIADTICQVAENYGRKHQNVSRNRSTLLQQQTQRRNIEHQTPNTKQI